MNKSEEGDAIKCEQSPSCHTHTATLHSPERDFRFNLNTAGKYRGTSLRRNHHPVGPYSRTMPSLLWWCLGGVGRFLMSEVPLYPGRETFSDTYGHA